MIATEVGTAEGFALFVGSAFVVAFVLAWITYRRRP